MLPVSFGGLEPSAVDALMAAERREDAMFTEHLKGSTVLIIEPDIESALDLQDRLADEGATVVTAYRQERALELVKRASLVGVVIESSVYEQNPDLRSRLCERNIPHVIHSPAKCIGAVVSELSALLKSPARPRVNDRSARRQPVAPLVVGRADGKAH